MKRLSLALLGMLFLTTAAWAAEVAVPRPSGNLNLQLRHPSSISLFDMATAMTHERLNELGWSIKSGEFTRTDFNTQALAQGTVQLALRQVLHPIRLSQGGGKVAFLMENHGGEVVLIAKRELKDFKAL